MVNLLTERGRLTADAARATLLDLAARRVLELHQPGANPQQTLVRVRQQRPADLRPYESLVLDRVLHLGGGDRFVPLADLSAGAAGSGRRWRKDFDAAVRSATANLGYTEERISGPMAFLFLTAFFIAITLASVVLDPSGSAQLDEGFASETGTGTGNAVAYLCLAGVLLLAMLAYLTKAREADGLKAAGQGVAAHWLGVADWLRAHENFAELPPAAVTVWDRYLPYGVALGTNPAAASVIDLRAGRTDTLWSPHGGDWHRIRVRQPGPWGHRGAPAVRRLVRGAAIALVGLGGAGLAWRATPDPLWLTVALAAAGVVAALGLYRVVTALIDLAAPGSIEGTVLRLAPTTDPAPPGFPVKPLPLRLVVDDGTGSRTRPWTVAVGQAGDCGVGDLVRLRGQRFGRYATVVTLVLAAPRTTHAHAAATLSQDSIVMTIRAR